MIYKFYADVQHLKELPQFDLSNVIACSGDVEEVKNSWDFYMNDDTILRYKYTDRVVGKKYEHRFGYSLVILVPNTLSISDLEVFSTHFMGDMLKNTKKVDWIAEKIVKGKGLYVKFHICLARKYKKEKKVSIFYTSDVYRDSITGRMAKKDNENAVLVYQAGDLKREVSSEWSKKIRLFEMSRSEFTESLIPLMRSYALKALNRVKKVKEVFYLKSLKHKTLNNLKKSKYYNMNVKYYNGFIDEFNEQIAYWDSAIHSPAGYYQHQDTLDAWNTLKYRYMQQTTNKKFGYSIGSSKKIKLSLNPWINIKKFRENIGTLREMFELDMEKFLETHISL